MNMKPQMRTDPETGALLFSSSPEAKLLLGLREDVKQLTITVSALVEAINRLQGTILKETEETPNG